MRLILISFFVIIMSMVYTKKIHQAIRFATKTHDIYQKQIRKGKGSSYITHPLTVGIILTKAGVSEDVIVAGILHDTIEDSIAEKKVTVEMLTERFGANVAQLVLDVTETDKKMSWEDRKKEALQHIDNFSHDSLLVKSADIIANMTEMADDYAKYGEDFFNHFRMSKNKMIENQLITTRRIIDCWPENPLFEDLLNLIDILNKMIEVK